MRTRTSWLALLLTAGVALAPTGARAQEVPPPDPVFPLPLYHDRPETGGIYAASEFLFMRQNNPLKHQIIAVRGLEDFDGTITRDLNQIFVPTPGGQLMINPDPAHPIRGLFLGSGRTALDAEQAAGPLSYQPGFRITLGWRFRDGLAIEASWMTLLQAKYQAVATLVPPTLNPGQFFTETFLFSPVYNFPNEFAGPPMKLAVGGPFAAYGIWNGASIEEIIFVQRYTQYDITARVPIFENEYCRSYGLIGGRHISLWERFKWRTVAEDVDGIAGQDDVALYSNVVSNQLYGVDVGIGSEVYWGIGGQGFGINLDLRAAAMVDIVHEIAKYERADFSIESKRAKRDYQVAPELEAELNFTWYPIEGVQVRVGYDLFALFNTISAPQPVSFNYGGLDPAWKRESLRWFDGFQAGIAFIF